MASAPQYRPPTLGDLLNNFGVDPQLVNGGVIGFCDIAEDFLSRLSRHHVQPEQQAQPSTAGASTPGQGCPAAGGQQQSTSAEGGQQPPQVPSPYDFWRQIQQSLADYHGAAAPAATADEASRECRRKCPYASGKQFELKVDVNGYKQDDLKIKVENGFITISGRHESGDENSSESRQFERRHKLPADIILEKMTSKIHKGVLIVAAPLKTVAPPPKKHQVIPIQVVGGDKPVEAGPKTGPSSPTVSTDEEPMAEDAFEKLE